MRNSFVKRTKPIGAGLIAMMSLALSGCLSLDTEAPESLLTLTPMVSAPVGASGQAGAQEAAGAIAVLTPEVPAKLDVLRVPVNVSDTEIAYLADTVWIEKPARLFRRVLGESLRAKAGETGVLVIDSDDTPVRAAYFLRGTLSEMSYDPSSAQVVVRFDAIRSDTNGNAHTKGFEAREAALEADPDYIGPALNRAANTVADEVAEWMAQ